jgi:hypothetical protein
MINRTPLTGFNHNIKYRKRIFHVQTEDSGAANPHISTHLFQGGLIIASARIDYSDIVEEGDNVEKVKKLMQGQHKLLMKQLIGGHFDDKIVALLGSLEPPFVAGTGELAAPGAESLAGPAPIEELAAVEALSPGAEAFPVLEPSGPADLPDLAEEVFEPVEPVEPVVEAEPSAPVPASATGPGVPVGPIPAALSTVFPPADVLASPTLDDTISAALSGSDTPPEVLPPGGTDENPVVSPLAYDATIPLQKPVSDFSDQHLRDMLEISADELNIIESHILPGPPPIPEGETTDPDAANVHLRRQIQADSARDTSPGQYSQGRNETHSDDLVSVPPPTPPPPRPQTKSHPVVGPRSATSSRPGVPPPIQAKKESWTDKDSSALGVYAVPAVPRPQSQVPSPPRFQAKPKHGSTLQRYTAPSRATGKSTPGPLRSESTNAFALGPKAPTGQVPTIRSPTGPSAPRPRSSLVPQAPPPPRPPTQTSRPGVEPLVHRKEKGTQPRIPVNREVLETHPPVMPHPRPPAHGMPSRPESGSGSSPVVIVSRPVHVGGVPRSITPSPPHSRPPVVPRPAVPSVQAPRAGQITRSFRPGAGPPQPQRSSQTQSQLKPPVAADARTQPGLFGSEVVSERSLDEVILAYLAEDVGTKDEG